MNEFELIDRYFDRGGDQPGPAGVVLGIGDDCALLRPPRPGHLIAISSDMLVEGRHFFAGTEAAAIGHKTLAVNLSDLAAMGAAPMGFTLAVALPTIDPDWLGGFTRGLFALADRHGCPLVGGDTTRGPLCLSVTVFGDVPEATVLRRDGATAGDDLWVSGPLGAAAAAVAARTRGDHVDPAALERLDRPRPRLALGRALLGLAHAAIDLSDGLGGDLGHVLKASSRRGGEPLGAELSADAIPVDPVLAGMAADEALQLALHGGDDYELLFAAPLAARERIGGLVIEDGFGVAPPVRIGTIVRGGGIRLLAPGTAPRPVAGGFDHFAAD
jgi:thiamine-monophosphate kinase